MTTTTHRSPNLLSLMSTGVPGLDEVLGGGLPEYSFNLVAGPPGAGKTTLVHQILFANATAARPASYFTVVGEPPLKMLRYQQQMEFFDPAKIGEAIRFIDLSKEVLDGDLNSVLNAIVAHVEEHSPAIVVVDSFRSVVRSTQGSSELELQGFLQKLSLYLASWQTTSFLVGEYGAREMSENTVFTVADGILWLSQEREGNAGVRKLEVVKLRGLGNTAGHHTFRITSGGIRVFPRDAGAASRPSGPTSSRAAFGVPVLDEMLGGGLPAGDATLVAGPSGSGKTVLCTHFVAEGAKQGETSVLALFEERPEDYVQRAADLGFDLQSLVDAGQLVLLALRPLDLSADEICQRIRDAMDKVSAKRLVIDSLNGLEIALSPSFRIDLRDSLFRIVAQLTGGDASTLITIEVAESFNELKFSPHEVSFMAQNIILLRYVELAGALQKVMTVVKMRRSEHSRDLHNYELTGRGVVVDHAMRGYSGVLTGNPWPVLPKLSGLLDDERAVLAALSSSNEAAAAALAEATRLPLPTVERALQRLVSLHYAVPGAAGDGRLYRVVSRWTGE